MVFSDAGAQENKVCHCFHYFPVYLSWSNGTRCHDLCFLNGGILPSLFTFLFHLHQEALRFLFTSCHKGDVICMLLLLSDSVWPHRQQPTRLLHPWDSPGKNTGVGCYFLLWSSAYLRLLMFLLAILIPACASASLAFCMIYSAYKLNKHGDSIQPLCTPFPIWNQSVVPCLVWLLLLDLHTGFSGGR